MKAAPGQKKLWIIRVKLLNGHSETTKTPFEGTEFDARMMEVHALAWLMSNGVFPSDVQAFEYVPEKPAAADQAAPALVEGARLVG